MGKLSGKVAIVTGAARGLGEGIARRLAEEGASVICADVNEPTMVVSALRAETSGRHTSAVLNVADGDAFDALVAETVRAHSRLDIMVNNAGIYVGGAIAETDDATFKRVMDVNLLGVFHGCRAAARVMIEQKNGRVINSASQLGKVGRATEGVYAASKAGVILLTQALALELAPHGITANCICPGALMTPMLEFSFQHMANQRGVALDDVMNSYIRENIPSGRFGTPADMGATVAWLASDDASFINGAAINLTGAQQVFF
ncbi:SDR family NAD(P)-dependent oxidoreductase [Acidisoma sp. S159]|jgi:NAD(P)-dependent dehydrogenase (short-subunit alcohol dehydrogenase family)|uniref:SDR family NAD(P)-dependent oxidoreductase n=1 Tax=Acidisoma sp. S159 TaxID=1747225 RepID=UPI00131C2707|nr:SDR family NAD(P)-dependent oxidoreductase [Acidisoma sp. S159]